MRKTLFLSALLASSAAMADPQTAPASATSPNTYNPNAVVCRTVSETGSRLERSRVCMTRAQWDQHNRDTRQTVDRAQEGRVLGTTH